MAAAKPVESRSSTEGGSLKVVAPLVSVKDEKGNVKQLSRGDIIPEGTSQESIDHLRDLGFVESE